MDKSLETSKLPKLKKEEIENLNRPITSKEIESVIKKPPTTKVQSQKTSHPNFANHLKKI